MARTRTTTVMVVPTTTRGGRVALAPMSPASRQLVMRIRQRQACRSALLLLGLLSIILGTILSLTVRHHRVVATTTATTTTAAIDNDRVGGGSGGWDRSTSSSSFESTKHLRRGATWTTTSRSDGALKDEPLHPNLPTRAKDSAAADTATASATDRLPPLAHNMTHADLQKQA